MAWRTAGRLGLGGGPSGAFFPPSRRCETSVLEEGEGDHSHERVPVQARPRATLEVVEAEFLLELLVMSNDIRNPAGGDIENPATRIMLMVRLEPWPGWI